MFLWGCGILEAYNFCSFHRLRLDRSLQQSSLWNTGCIYYCAFRIRQITLPITTHCAEERLRKRWFWSCTVGWGRVCDARPMATSEILLWPDLDVGSKPKCPTFFPAPYTQSLFTHSSDSLSPLPDFYYYSKLVVLPVFPTANTHQSLLIPLSVEWR